jgi:hypothetical protein
MSTRALQFDILLLGFRDPDTDAPLAKGVVNFYSAGTSTPLTVWDTKEKTGARTSVPLDDNGQFQVYGDGVYKLEILDSTGTPVSYSRYTVMVFINWKYLTPQVHRFLTHHLIILKSVRLVITR